MSKPSTKKHARTPAAQVEVPAIETAAVETAPVEVAPAPVEVAPVEAKAAKVRYAKRDWAATDIITLLVEKNPKSKKSAGRYALYRTGMSVAEYAEAVGNKTLANADLRWDVARNFISIAPAAQA